MNGHLIYQRYLVWKDLAPSSKYILDGLIDKPQGLRIGPCPAGTGLAEPQTAPTSWQ